MHNLDVHTKAGLVYGGLNEEGEAEWIGTDSQWEAYQNLEMAESMLEELPPEVINELTERN